MIGIPLAAYGGFGAPVASGVSLLRARRRVFTDAEVRSWGVTPQLIIPGVNGSIINVVSIRVRAVVTLGAATVVNYTLRYDGIGGLQAIAGPQSLTSVAGTRYTLQTANSMNNQTGAFDLISKGVELVPSNSGAANYTTSGGTIFELLYVLFKG